VVRAGRALGRTYVFARNVARYRAGSAHVRAYRSRMACLQAPASSAGVHDLLSDTTGIMMIFDTTGVTMIFSRTLVGYIIFEGFATC